ncbi:OmpA family protein [Vibrio quintilis]|uniref:Outer membrane protein P6 n=1 Tax=Vibrio quintilis TaxID=1117707 RepID=A0A1M7YVE8_9VIBR|nr:OmpA family protein [Vibrio quintilis]SHO56533.1 Outer membrane protein P6 precursor [Vibrio quintilis]
MLTLQRLLIFAACLSVTASVMAQIQEDHWVRICGKSGLTVKEEVQAGNAIRVSLHQGTKMRTAVPGHQPVRGLLVAELKKTGINQKCAEYFLSSGLSSAAQTGKIPGRVYFRFDSHTLTPASVTVLDSLLAKIKSDSRIVLEGNTDATGPAKYNFSLGLKRAASVQTYLTQHQVATENTRIVSYGENHPVALNTSVQGRRLNRRVDIAVYQSTASEDGMYQDNLNKN